MPMNSRGTDSRTLTVSAIDRSLATLRRDLTRLGLAYPDDTTHAGRYVPRPAAPGFTVGANRGWTTGFWPGLCWLGWELSGDEVLRGAAQAHLRDFEDRIYARREIDTHDLGFLYTLACVAPWRLLGDERARAAAVEAAERLLDRFLLPAGVIQAWGDLDDPRQRGRAIIDSLMNTPLLYWASEVTGDPRYAQAGERHACQLRDHILRADGTTFHTFRWDPETGAAIGGSTHQGQSDESCWARGQAWGVYGFTLNYLGTGDSSFLAAAGRCADVLIDRLPEDLVPYWDLVFTDGSDEPRDSSAAAIAASGLQELAAALPPGAASERYAAVADAMLDSLIEYYTPTDDEPADALLLHGVYTRPTDLGVDEGNLWGDYFFLEALTRRTVQGWRRYW